MFHQTTLDYALQKITLSQRRAELAAMHRAVKAARRREAPRGAAARQPEMCCCG